MANYVKVTPTVAKKLGVDKIRYKVADGNYLLWQCDLMCVSGQYLDDKIKTVGGAKLTNTEAKAEMDGNVVTPAHVYTPEEFCDNE